MLLLPVSLPVLWPKMTVPSARAAMAPHREALPSRPRAQALCVDKSQPVKVQHQAHIGPVIPIGREVDMVLPEGIGENAHSLGQTVWGHALNELILPHSQIDCILNGTTLEPTSESIDTI